jgi:prevent-host-death family protein
MAGGRPRAAFSFAACARIVVNMTKTADPKTTIGVAEAKAKLSELIDQVERGGEVVLSRYGRAVARIVPIAPAKIDRSGIFGCMEGKIWIADDFDAPLPDDIQRYFEGYDDEDETSG